MCPLHVGESLCCHLLLRLIKSVLMESRCALFHSFACSTASPCASLSFSLQPGAMQEGLGLMDHLMRNRIIYIGSRITDEVLSQDKPSCAVQ